MRTTIGRASTRRRVCIVAASELTVRAFLVDQLQAMQERCDVTVVVNTANRDLLADLGISAELCPIAIQREISVWSDVRALGRLIALMRAGQFDLVHSFTPKAGLLAMLAAGLTRVPVRVHTFTGQVWATRRGLARAALKALDRIIARCATFTLADGLLQREFLVKERIARAGRLVVLGRGSVKGIDPQRFRPDSSARHAVRQQLGIPDTALLMLFIGRLQRDKGVLDLAEAFAALARERHDVHLLVVGPDEHNLKNAVQAVCREHANRLHFIEFTNTPEAMMAASDVVCLPSYREGFSNVIIEAASAGVPAVASRIYGIIDAVEEERTALLHEPRDPDDLLRQLRRITRDTALRLQLGEQARARACRDFLQRDITSALIELHARLVRSAPRTWYTRFGKRALDLLLGILALAVLLPLAAIAGALIRIFLGAPVLFRQQRPGLHGVPFELIKFRTMREGRGAGGELLPDGERLTRLGRALRAASLDEIPELWNVIRGEMSLVGPRPLLMQYLPLYDADQARRHDVRPGITGLAQVQGRNGLGWAERFRFDVEYVDRVSLGMDLRILLRTPWAVLSQRGIAQPGRATVDNFQGNTETHG